MNKKLLLTLFALGVVIFGTVIFFVVKKGKSGGVTEEAVTEIPFAQRPVASLIPSEDGHWLKLKIDKIAVAKAESLDYELLYSLPDGRTQGVPGNVKLEGASNLERDLLLGSESSGKFRYDEGVEEGSLTVRFRDSKGKLLAKFNTKFHLQTDVVELVSIDSNFVYTLEKEPKGIWFITMETFGLPDSANVSNVEAGPYGIFTSGDSIPDGSAEGWQSTSSNFFYK